MKITITTVLTVLLLTAFSAQSQILSEQQTTDITKFNPADDDQTYLVKTVDQQYQLLKFKKTDEGKLNQHIKETASKVSKKILIDQDNDGSYDKQFKLYYDREDQNLEYLTTNDDLLIRNEDKSAYRISEEGVYELDTDQVEDIIIKVETL